MAAADAERRLGGAGLGERLVRGRGQGAHVARRASARGAIEGGRGVVTIDLPVPRKGKWIVLPRVLRRGGPGHGKLRLIPRGRTAVPSDAKLVWEWKDDEGGAKPGHDVCTELPALETAHGVDLDEVGADLELTATGGDVSLDQTTLKATR